MRFGRRCLAAAVTAAVAAALWRPRAAPLSRPATVLLSCSRPFSPPLTATRSLFLLRFCYRSPSVPPSGTHYRASRSLLLFPIVLVLVLPLSVSPARFLVTASSYCLPCRRLDACTRHEPRHAHHASFRASHRLLSPTPTPKRALPATAAATTSTTVVTTTSTTTPTTTATSCAPQRCPRRRPRPRRLCRRNRVY